jgi:negative regulator of sigma E activity
MWHPDEGTLHALLDGELDSTEVARVQAHLSDCADCRTVLSEAQEFRDVARTLVETLDEADDRQPTFASPAEPAPSAAGRAVDPEPASVARGTPSAAPRVGPRRPRARWIAGLAWAATVVLAVSAGYLLAGRRSHPEAAARDLALSDSARLEQPQIAATPPAHTDEGAPSARPATEPKAEAAGPAAKRAAPKKSGAAADQRADAAAEPPPRPAMAAELTRQAAAPKVVGRAGAAGPADSLRADSLRKAALERLNTADIRLDELVVAGVPESSRARVADRIQVRGASLAPGVARPAVDSALQAAQAFLGAPVQVIDGLSPTRVEVVDSVVRLHYRVGGLAFMLEEWREGTALRTRVVAPEGTPPDSVAAWTRRIR